MRFIIWLIAIFIFDPVYASEILVSNKTRTLTYFENGNKVKTYNVAVGKPSLQWSSVYQVSRKAVWPTWIPTAAQHRRKKLPLVVKGGPKSPLGARALYLGNSLYRIHGTNNPSSIGKAVSNGCIRMLNSDIIELYPRISVGTRVIVR